MCRGSIIGVAAVALLIPGPAEPAGSSRGDVALQRLLATSLPLVRAADAQAADGRGGSDALQAQYDTARALFESLRLLPPVSRGCSAVFAAAKSLAIGQMREAEGADRTSERIQTAGRTIAARAEVRLRRPPTQCTAGPLAPRADEPRELREPRDGEAFPGVLRAPAPRGTTEIDVLVGGKPIGTTAPRAGRLLAHLSKQYGRWTVGARFRAGKRVLGTAASRRAWLLPESAQLHVPPKADDGKLSGRLALLAGRFNGHVAIWTHDLRTGSTAGWNEDARFPAASTVKLGVLIAALRKFGPRPERSRVAYDLQTLAGWSSNLAANRLLAELGGSEGGGSAIAQETLHRLGALSSTYTGNYRVGTGAAGPRAHAGAPDPPPVVSQRVTTARDLGRILYLLHAAAMGDASAQRTTGLSRHEARVGLALLLASQPRTGNLGLLRPSLGKTPIAQKNGWLRDAEHTAAIVYRDSRPTIVVILTYRPGIKRAEAARFAEEVVRVAVPPS